MARLIAIVLILGLYRPDTLLARVVFEAGKIDSNAVEIGAYVAITYGEGERDSISGKWERMATVRGYIEAVDSERVIIGVDSWKTEIDRDRIHNLIARNEKRDEDSASRTIKKLGGGVLAGGLFMLGGAAVGEMIARATCNNPDAYNDGWIGCTGDGAIPGALIGYTVGMPIGVSMMDPYDQLWITLSGSFVGMGFGAGIVASNDDYWPALIIGPLVGTVIMSEVARNLPTAIRRFSVGIAPAPDGSVSALATLRF